MKGFSFVSGCVFLFYNSVFYNVSECMCVLVFVSYHSVDVH